MNMYTWALVGTGITFAATILGAATVFLFPRTNAKFNRACMGFAGGVMVAAAVFSLLLPALTMAEEFTPELPPIIPVVLGFALGGLFLFGLDKLIPHLHMSARRPEGPKSGMKRTSLLFTAVTLHNIPEGMAVGLAFALSFTTPTVTLAAAMALAIGIAIQNFPEGAAISLPLRQEGMTKKRAFLFGALSGVVEPLGGMLFVVMAQLLIPAMPWLLSFAAGAMLYVVVEELVPAATGEGEHSNIGVLSFMVGFIIMMTLDIALG